MLRKLAFFGLSVATIVAFVCIAQKNESKYLSASLRADVAAETDLAQENVVFLTDYELAVGKAEKENKPALLFFMSKTCKHSVNMLNGAFASSRVEKLAKQFVCVQIDMNDPKNDDICDEFDVVASPTVQFVSASGVPLQRVAAEQTGEQLATQMQAALTSVAWHASRAEERGLLR